MISDIHIRAGRGNERVTRKYSCESKETTEGAGGSQGTKREVALWPIGQAELRGLRDTELPLCLSASVATLHGCAEAHFWPGQLPSLWLLPFHPPGWSAGPDGARAGQKPAIRP